MVIVKEEWRDEIPLMSAVDIYHRNRGAREEVLAYFRDTEPLIKKFYPGVRRPVLLQNLWPGP
jgi:hypothetical protein